MSVLIESAAQASIVHHRTIWKSFFAVIFYIAVSTIFIWRRPPDGWGVGGWIAFSIFTLAYLGYCLWEQFGIERLQVDADELIVKICVGNIDLIEKRYDSSLISNMRWVSYRQSTRGRTTVKQKIIYEYKKRVESLSMEINQEDAQRLLDGPLKRFRESMKSMESD